MPRRLPGDTSTLQRSELVWSDRQRNPARLPLDRGIGPPSLLRPLYALRAQSHSTKPPTTRKPSRTAKPSRIVKAAHDAGVSAAGPQSFFAAAW